jgi:hypothetical protein
MMLTDLFLPNPDYFTREIAYNNLLTRSSFNLGLTAKAGDSHKLLKLLAKLYVTASRPGGRVLDQENPWLIDWRWLWPGTVIGATGPSFSSQIGDKQTRVAALAHALSNIFTATRSCSVAIARVPRSWCRGLFCVPGALSAASMPR